MRLPDEINCLFDDAAAGKHESAVMHACAAVDATAKRLYPSLISVKGRFVRCLRDYYWLLEPMIGVGFNLVDTQFENLGPPMFKSAPDIAEVIYYAHRCSHMHGDEVPNGFVTIATSGPKGSHWRLGPDVLNIPDRVVWALAAIAVLSRVNDRFKGSGGARYLTYSDQRFPIAEWWGRESDFKPLAEGWNTIRVKLEGLGRMREANPFSNEIARIEIADPDWKMAQE